MPYLKQQDTQPESLSCRILTAALDLFVQQGFHNISIHEIQRQAQVSIGSIYNHFGGKEGIARALYQHLLNELDELIDDALTHYATPTQQYQRIISDLFHYTETHSNMIAFLFHTHHADFLPDEPQLSESLAFQKMQSIIKNGITNGDFRKGDEIIAFSILFGSAIQIIQGRLENKISTPLPDYLEEFFSTLQNTIILKSENFSSNKHHELETGFKIPLKKTTKLCANTSWTG